MTNKLLIVDDDRELLKMLKQYFERKGYLVMLAENGEEALEKSIQTEVTLEDAYIYTMNVEDKAVRG